MEMQKKIADEFASWPMSQEQIHSAHEIRAQLDMTLDVIAQRIPPHNGRYLALIKTKLEEAGFFAVKGIARPE